MTNLKTKTFILKLAAFAASSIFAVSAQAKLDHFDDAKTEIKDGRKLVTECVYSGILESTGKLKFKHRVELRPARLLVAPHSKYFELVDLDLENRTPDNIVYFDAIAGDQSFLSSADNNRSHSNKTVFGRTRIVAKAEFHGHVDNGGNMFFQLYEVTSDFELIKLGLPQRIWDHFSTLYPKFESYDRFGTMTVKFNGCATKDMGPGAEDEAAAASQSN